MFVSLFACLSFFIKDTEALEWVYEWAYESGGSEALNSSLLSKVS